MPGSLNERQRRASAAAPASLGQGARAWLRRGRRAYERLSPAQRALTLACGVAACGLGVAALMLSPRLFAWLAPRAAAWRARPGGWILVFLLVFATAFPPLVGYATATTIAGFVYGFPAAWPLAAAACVAGSLCAFLACRSVLAGYVDGLIGRDPRFVALGQVLRREGLLYLTAVRFCPLPFSLSNGFLATVPSVSPLAFALSTALSSPKLLVHVFIGSRLARLADGADSMTAADKAVNYLSMLAGAGVGLVVGIAIYRRTMARAAEIARESADDDTGFDIDADPEPGYYHDSDSILLDPEDAAAVMLDENLSLADMQAPHASAEAYEDGSDDDDNRQDAHTGCDADAATRSRDMAHATA